MHFRMFWRRFCAFTIDNLILGFITFLIQFFLVNSIGIVNSIGVEVFKISLFYGLLTIAYFTLLEYSPAHATIGKQIMHLQVCNMEYKDITLVQAFGRNLARLLNSFIFSLGYIPILFTKREQGIHDMIGRTLVVDRDELEEFWAEQEEME